MIPTALSCLHVYVLFCDIYDLPHGSSRGLCIYITVSVNNTLLGTSLFLRSHYLNLNPFSAGIVFIRQNLTSLDARCPWFMALMSCVNSCIMHCVLLVHHHGMLPSSNSNSNFIAAWYEHPNGTFFKWWLKHKIVFFICGLWRNIVYFKIDVMICVNNYRELLTITNYNVHHLIPI